MKHNSIILVLTAALFIFISLVGCEPTIKPSGSAADTTAAANSESTTAPSGSVADTASDIANTTKSNLSSENQLAATAKLAESLVGKPYQYGAAGPDSFDNSGFIVYCFSQNGLSLPRKTGDIAKVGTGVDKSELKPGDVLFFYNENPGAVEYAGIYLGNNQFVASNDEKNPVSIHSLTNTYFETRFLFARRFF